MASLRVAVRSIRVGAVRDLTHILAGGGQQVCSHVAVRLDEPGQAAGCQAGHVLPDKDLGVTSWPGANSDGRDAERGRYPAPQFGWHGLQDDGNVPALSSSRASASSW